MNFIINLIISLFSELGEQKSVSISKLSNNEYIFSGIVNEPILQENGDPSQIPVYYTLNLKFYPVGIEKKDLNNSPILGEQLNLNQENNILMSKNQTNSNSSINIKKNKE